MRSYKIKAILLIVVLFCNVSTFADTLWQKDVRYALYEDGTAKVCDARTEINVAIIPEKIAYKGKDYVVIGIEDGAFNRCSSLVSIILPNSITNIGNSAFYCCSSLVSVVIPNSVNSIGSNAFAYCSSLASVAIPNSVTIIESGMFLRCSSLASVTIPNFVTCIRYNAFRACSSLSSIVIPSTVTSIEPWAFNGCTGIKKIECKATTPPACALITLGGVNWQECKLYVPRESINAYKSAQAWKVFYNIETGIKGVPKSASATVAGRYTTGGMRIASPQKGINIIKMSDGTVKKVLVK